MVPLCFMELYEVSDLMTDLVFRVLEIDVALCSMQLYEVSDLITDLVFRVLEIDMALCLWNCMRLVT